MTPSPGTTIAAFRLLAGRAMLDRESADLAVVAHSSFVDDCLDFAARVIVRFEPQAGQAEIVLAGLMGGLVGASVLGVSLSGLVTALTLATEHGIDAALLEWARNRIAIEKGS